MVYKMKIATCEIRQVTCSMYEYNKKCTISGLTLTLKNYTFVPIATNFRIVTKFEITGSVVPVITGNVCTTFTKLKNFAAIEQHVEQIEDYAFKNCTELIDLNLEKNSIHKLGEGVFSNTKQLQRLHLLGASLGKIDVDMFSNLSELNQLVYSASGLKELPVAAIQNLKKLEYLYLYSNELADLDTEGLIKNLPNLRTLYINDNNFHCDRLIEIINAFKARNIIVHDHTYSLYIKKRDYIPRKINNIICLSQAQLESEKLKKALTSSLEELKVYPIGKAVIQLKEVVTTGFTDADSNIVTLSNTLNETSDNLNEQISNVNETLKNTSSEISESITALFNLLNETTENLNEQISYLNETFKKTSTEFSENRNSLKENIADQITGQHILEEKITVATTKLQEMADSVALMMEKYNTIMGNLASSDKLSGNSNQGYDTLVHSIVAIWMVLICLLLTTVATAFFVHKKFSNIHVDVPILCYENGSDRICHGQQ